MDKVNLCTEVILTGITLIIAVISFLIKSVKSSKNEKKAKAELHLNDILLKLMEDAEKYLNYSGEEKKSFVITRVKEELLTHKIKPDEAVIKDKIERLIELSKNVNNQKNNHKTLNKLNEGENND